MNRINLINELTEPGYKVGLFTSFSTDLVFFEKMILRHLIDQNCTYLGLFIDQRSLYDAITKPNISEIGKSYVVKGVETNRAFHPKVYLLLGEDKAKVIIGSGNLTPAGFITNYEVFNHFTYNKTTGDTENLAEIQAAFHMIHSLHQDQDNEMWKELFTKTREFTYLWKNTEESSLLLSNHKTALQEQLGPLLPSNIQKIECFVPYFDTTLSVITKWNDLYKPEEIFIYLQDQNTNFPRQVKYKPNIYLFEAIFLENTKKRYHGKVFRFIGEDAEVIVYGSGNCSRQAFLYPFHAGGNAESIVVEQGLKGEFNDFFKESIKLIPLPNPLPDHFETIETSDQEDKNNEVLRIKYIDGIIRNKKLLVTLKLETPFVQLFLKKKEGNLTHTNGNYYVYSFDVTVEQLSPIFSLEGYLQDICLSFIGWCHDPISLQNTFYNIKQSVHFQLEDDPYLDDYHNLVALLDDLQKRLVLTEKDIGQAGQMLNRLKSIHQQAELSDTSVYVNNNKEDYYANEERIGTYGSIGQHDVLGNLIRSMLRIFHEGESDSLRTTEEKSDAQNISALEAAPKDLSEHLQKRMKRFMKKFKHGITSEHYLENIEPDMLIKNITIYSGFLFKLKQKLGDHFLTKAELVSEYFNIVKALEHYSEKNILDTSRQDMQALLIQILATLFAKEHIFKNSENNFFVSKNNKEIGSTLKHVHQRIHPVGHDISTHSYQVSQFLQWHFGINIAAASYEQWFKNLFPLLRFTELEQKISKEDVHLKMSPIVDDPTISLEIELKILTGEFNYKQLKLLVMMLTVEEWEDASAFKIRCFNSDIDSPLKRFVLYYNQKKRILKKKYVYKERESLIEQKRNVYKSQLQTALEQRQANILGQNFKDEHNK